jgi:hypothetical protein
MIKKGNLNSLIKSLSKSEKRYFRIFAQVQKIDSNILKLYRVIEKQNDINDDEIREIFKGQKFTKQLHVLKIALVDIILKSLKNFTAKQSVKTQIIELIKDVDLLFQKELYNLCLVKIKRAEKLSKDFEFYGLYQEVLNQKRKWLQKNLKNSKDMQLSILHEQEKNLVEQKDLINLLKESLNIFSLTKSNLINTELKEKTSDSLNSKTLQLYYNYSLNFLKGKMDSANEDTEKLISLLEDYPLRIKEDPSIYITAINNRIGFLLSINKQLEIPSLLDKLKKCSEVYVFENKFKLNHWLRIYNLELEYYIDTKDFNKAESFISIVKHFLSKNAKNISLDYFVMFYYQFSLVYFYLGKYNESLKWSNEQLNNNYENYRLDIQTQARILNLMLHYEMGNKSVLKYGVESFERFFKKNKLKIMVEKSILLFFKKSIKANLTDNQLLFDNLLSTLTSNNFTKKYLYVEDWIKLKNNKR